PWQGPPAFGPRSAPTARIFGKQRRRRDLATKGGTALLEKARPAPASGRFAGPFSAHEEASRSLKNHIIPRRKPLNRREPGTGVERGIVASGRSGLSHGLRSERDLLHPSGRRPERGARGRVLPLLRVQSLVGARSRSHGGGLPVLRYGFRGDGWRGWWPIR